MIGERYAATLRRMRRLEKFCLRLMLTVFTLNVVLLPFNAEALLEAPSNAEHASVCDDSQPADSNGACSDVACNHMCHAGGHFLGYVSRAPEIIRFPHTSGILHSLKDAAAPTGIADSQFRPPRTSTLI
ncbi:MAG: hypothetical protein ABI612_12570 [Betaproteobacteria bacterium]